MISDRQREIFSQAVQAVQAAARLIRQPRREEVGEKGRTDFVTPVDYAVQDALEAALYRIDPRYQLLAEEGDHRRCTDPMGGLWILDPVDGTTNLIHNFRHSAISLALAEEGRVWGGIIYDPDRRELYTALKGEGAFCNGQRLQVSPVAALSDALCSVGTNPGSRERADQAFRRMRAIYDRCHDIRRMGAASLELCYVAAGRLDCYVEHGLQPWDYAAGGLMVTEAGGSCTSFGGSAPTLSGSNGIAATNGRLHREILNLL